MMSLNSDSVTLTEIAFAFEKWPDIDVDRIHRERQLNTWNAYATNTNSAGLRHSGVGTVGVSVHREK